jgi:hypothetical protein
MRSVRCSNAPLAQSLVTAIGLRQSYEFLRAPHEVQATHDALQRYLQAGKQIYAGKSISLQALVAPNVWHCL